MVIRIKSIDRNDLAYILAGLNMNIGAEIGVEVGRYSKVLCEANKDLLLYCIDPWEAYPEYKAAKNHKSFEDNYKATKERLAGYNCRIIRKKSADAVKDFFSCYMDFVYIDGNHQFEYVLQDLELWTKIIRRNGIIFGHDYDKPEVKEAVDFYVKENNIDTLFVLGTGRYSSWLFINKSNYDKI